MKIAKYYKTLENGYIECELCPKHCKIANSQRGLCRLRENKNGILYAVEYAKTISVSNDPIEKKPLYHFYPGRKILSIGPNGCNLKCKNCQNWHISQENAPTQTYLPTTIVSLASQYKSLGIAYTYTEPLIWLEYILDVAPLARTSGLKNVLVTNGYINEEPLKEMLPYIDAINLDIKSMEPEFYKEICNGELEPVLRTASLAYRYNVHLEITNLVIPGYNDKDENFIALVRWIRDYLSKDTVLHFSAYFPHYKLDAPPTPIATLKKAKKIASDYLKYVYLGNVPGDNSTYCPNCNEILIKREGYSVRIFAHTNPTRCPKCQNRLPLILD